MNRTFQFGADSTVKEVQEECTIHVNGNKINVTTFHHNQKTTMWVNTHLPIDNNNISLTNEEAMLLATLLLQATNNPTPQSLPRGKYQFPI
ncbi:hypothetical protein KAW18_03975 [candidate division WOR-3 bacterium]|nr:hypothetical protein [candidate division WOR-3 bacterium]